MKLLDEFRVCEGILELERKIGVPENFFRDLNDADDWIFVIKLHALFEAACAHLLLYHLREPELASIVARLELSNKTTGKIVFLAKLKLVSADNRRFISTLSELRNSLVHDIRNHRFSLSDMLTRMDAKEVQTTAISFSPYETFMREHPFDAKLNLGYQGDALKQSQIPAVTERFRTDPRFHIWIGAYSVLVAIIDNYSYSDYLNWTKGGAGSNANDDE
jgi:hypothetical protein